MAPPLYVMVTTSLQKESGLALMQSAIARIEEVIDDEGGNLNIKVRSPEWMDGGNDGCNDGCNDGDNDGGEWLGC